MDIRLLVVDPAAADDLEFLFLALRSAQVDEDCLFMEERLQGIYLALCHPAPFLFGKIDYFLLQVCIGHYFLLVVVLVGW